MQFATVLPQYHHCDEITWEPRCESLKVSHRICRVICADKSSSPEEEIMGFIQKAQDEISTSKLVLLILCQFSCFKSC